MSFASIVFCPCRCRRRSTRSDQDGDLLAGSIFKDASPPPGSAARQRRPRPPAAVLSRKVLPPDFPEDWGAEEFSLGDVIGLGGQGYVLACTWRDGRQCAAKVFDPGKVEESPSAIDPITAEIDALSRFSHPNIVEYCGSLQVGGWRCIVTERISGGDLDGLVFDEGGGALSELEARHVFRQLAGCLGYVHSKKMLHRDLKLKNVLISKQSRAPEPLEGTLYDVKVIDFGLCSPYPQAATRVGTDLFVAPEVVGCVYDYAVDYWSLGVVLFCMLCAHYPYDDPCGHGAGLQDILDLGQFHFPGPQSPWHALTEEARELIRGLLTVEWRGFYGAKSRLGLEGCLQHPWAAPARPPTPPALPTVPPPERPSLAEVSLRRLRVTRADAQGCFLGSLEDARRAMPYFSEEHAGKCLDVGRRFGVQVVQIRRQQGGEPNWIGRPEPATSLLEGDVVFYGWRRALADRKRSTLLERPSQRRFPLQGKAEAGRGDGGAPPPHAEFESLLCASEADVGDATMQCFEFCAPAAWDRCVLGGEGRASSPQQGYLNIRHNWNRLTVAGLIPDPRGGAGGGARPAVLFPGGADEVRAGDTLLVPCRLRDDSADDLPLRGSEREAMQSFETRAKRALAARGFATDGELDGLCAKGTARRAR